MLCEPDIVLCEPVCFVCIFVVHFDFNCKFMQSIDLYENSAKTTFQLLKQRKILRNSTECMLILDKAN